MPPVLNASSRPERTSSAQWRDPRILPVADHSTPPSEILEVVTRNLREGFNVILHLTKQPDPPEITSPPYPQTPPQRTFLAPKRPVVTTALIAINVLVFLAMIASGLSFFAPTAEQVFRWGANYGPVTVQGQWWRLFTACFLHFGIIHIGFNMWVLYQIGYFTERLFGGPRYLAVYLIAGIGGNIIGLVLHPNVVAAGASGAIFGVYGGLLAFLLRRRGIVNPQAAKAVTRSVMIFLAYNLFYGLADRHTDLTAHIGGLVTGFVAGYMLAPDPRKLLQRG